MSACAGERGAGGAGDEAGARDGDRDREKRWVIPDEELEVGTSLGGQVFRGRWKGRAGAVAIKRLDAGMSGVEGDALERGTEELRRMAAACEGCKHLCP